MCNNGYMKEVFIELLNRTFPEYLPEGRVTSIDQGINCLLEATEGILECTIQLHREAVKTNIFTVKKQSLFNANGDIVEKIANYATTVKSYNLVDDVTIPTINKICDIIDIICDLSIQAIDSLSLFSILE
jgi:hypothetical protein